MDWSNLGAQSAGGGGELLQDSLRSPVNPAPSLEKRLRIIDANVFAAAACIRSRQIVRVHHEHLSCSARYMVGGEHRGSFDVRDVCKKVSHISFVIEGPTHGGAPVRRTAAKSSLCGLQTARAGKPFDSFTPSLYSCNIPFKNPFGVPRGNAALGVSALLFLLLILTYLLIDREHQQFLADERG